MGSMEHKKADEDWHCENMVHAKIISLRIYSHIIKKKFYFRGMKKNLTILQTKFSLNSLSMSKDPPSSLHFSHSLHCTQKGAISSCMKSFRGASFLQLALQWTLQGSSSSWFPFLRLKSSVSKNVNYTVYTSSLY